MTRSERTQLGWLIYWAYLIGPTRRMGFRGVLIWFLIFALACLAAGAVLEIIQRALA